MHVLAQAALAAALALPLAVAAGQRAFVASYGSDANAAIGCPVGSPCRGFAAAVGAVDNGGEVLALDSAGYGTLVVTKSVSLIANPGIYAGISVASGTGVDVPGAGVTVLLRGVEINSVGGSKGVNVGNGSTVVLENCVVSGFSLRGISASTGAKVRVIDTVLRNNIVGMEVAAAASADISGARFLGNSVVGLRVTGDTPPNPTSVVVSDTFAAGNGTAFVASAEVVGGVARLSVIRSVVVDSSGAGIRSASSIAGSTSVVVVSGSTVSRNAIGLDVLAPAGSATMRAMGNNTVRQNGTDTSGTVTATPTI